MGWIMFRYFLKILLETCHVVGSPTINNPIFASMSDSSHESGDQNIFFFTWRAFTFLFYFLPGRIIILSSVSVMSSFGVLLLIHGTISSKVSYFIACITSEFGWIPSYKIIFLMRMLTLVMMIFPSSFLGVYCEVLIFTSHLFFASFYSMFFLWTFLPQSTKLN